MKRASKQKAGMVHAVLSFVVPDNIKLHYHAPGSNKKRMYSIPKSIPALVSNRRKFLAQYDEVTAKK